MDKIIVVADADTVLGFRLAGVAEAHEAESEEEAERAVTAALSRSDAGILVITQQAMDALSPKTRRELSSIAKPAVIEVPGKRELDRGAESLSALIKKTMGIELK